MPSIAVRNFGCRANQAEAFFWADAFRERGLQLEKDCGRSDVVLINSCTLTGRADRDVRKFIRTVARKNPRTRIIVTGCYAERAPAEVGRMPNVVAVLPNSAKDRLPEHVIEYVGQRSISSQSGIVRPETGAGVAGGGSLRARAYLKVQDGCDDRCAFCIIPLVRGPSRSVAPEEIVAAVRNLADCGFREIVLAGIHLSSYGEDLAPRGSLLGLLQEIETVPGMVRFRLSSLDPRQIGDPLISHVGGSGRILPHIHLSLQHASGRLLRLMGRAVEPGSYGQILGEFRRLAPEAALGADIIVGFPRETEADFEELKNFLDGSPLTYFHVFPYSPRQGTPAAAWPRIPAAVVTDRAKTLRRLSARKDFRFRLRFLGQELEAVVIGKSERGAEVLTGNAIRVFVPACSAPVRERVRVAIRRVLPRRTEGEVDT